MALRFQRLTPKAIKALRPGEKINEHGISALCRKNGDVRFSVNIMVDGERIHRVIGRSSEGVTREQAERAIEHFRTKAREERLDLPTGRKVHRTFAEAATSYLDRLETTLGEGDKGFKDLRNKKRNLKTYLVPHFSRHRLDKITPFLVEHYVRERLSNGAVRATVNRELATLSHLFSSAIEWKWIKHTDRPRITKNEEAAKDIEVLTPAQAEALYRAAVADQDGQTWLFVAIGLNTAMRHSEIVRVQWSHINFDRRRINIPTAKAGQRSQPITVSLAAALRREYEQRQDDKWLFPTGRKTTKLPHRQDMRRQFERSVVRAKMSPAKVTPHVMRHTGITRLVEDGVPLPTIQKISGHKTLKALMRYVHLSDEHVNDSMAAIDTDYLDTVTPELHTGQIEADTEAGDIVPISTAKSAV